MFASKTASCAILALAGAVMALPSTLKRDNSTLTVFESVSGPPAEWVQDAVDALADEVLELRIGLALSNLEKFDQMALDIATPGSATYGQHMTLEQIDAVIAPKNESRDLVLEWIASHGLGDSAVVNARGNAVLVNATISQAEDLLSAKYSSYTNNQTGEQVSRAMSVSVPQELMEHISTIQPTTFFGFRPLLPTIHEADPDDSVEPDAVTGCTGTYITPTCLANLYNFKSISSLTSGKMGIAGFIQQHPAKSDLSTFLTKFGISGFGNTDESYTCTTVESGTCPASPGANAGVEANLDVQYARAITSNIPNEFYSVGKNNNQIYEYLADYILGLGADERPNVISVSYGGDESSVSKSVASATCTLFEQLGAAGVSVLFASGDSGVGSGCTIDGSKAYQPDFPGGCPWVTMVGGTTGTTTEKAWIDGGGGFSNYFARPTWQDDVVTSWLNNNDDGNTQYYNTAGRAYPDVAAAATYFEIVVNGKTEAVDGTSCAAPTFASVIELVNSNRIAAGKSALGFLNPWLYGNASSALNDITSGSIGGCSAISNAGFTAVTGWDPATGLGTPNYSKLLAVSDST